MANQWTVYLPTRAKCNIDPLISTIRYTNVYKECRQKLRGVAVQPLLLLSPLSLLLSPSPFAVLAQLA